MLCICLAAKHIIKLELSSFDWMPENRVPAKLQNLNFCNCVVKREIVRLLNWEEGKKDSYDSRALNCVEIGYTFGWRQVTKSGLFYKQCHDLLSKR